VLAKAMKELDRLAKMSFMSPEATVVRNYLDWLLAMPWKKRSKEIRELKHAEGVLEADHYGLEKIKDRRSWRPESRAAPGRNHSIW
jgi:ATP-dependent Lon protease